MTDINSRLERLRYLFGPGYEKRPNAEFGLELARELDWQTGNGSVSSQRIEGMSAEVHRGFIGKTPAVIFATDFSPDSQLSVREIASYSYQSSIEWGLVTNRFRTVIFNSHWAKSRDWFQLEFGSDESSRLAELLAAFTPSGIETGKVEEVARRHQQEDERLVAVDDGLVDLLDEWRDEAFRTAETDNGIDDAVQTLFSQLFILRAIEDRGIAPTLTSIRSVLRPGKVADFDVLANLFAAARRLVQSELFEEQPFQQLPPHVVGGIISDLYKPTAVPIETFTYNFAWISASVLGRAYEKYLSTVIVARPKIVSQMSIWPDALREAKRVSRRKEGGVYYTPDFVVQYLTKRCIDQYFDRHPLFGHQSSSTYRLPVVIDPACGSGSFLTAAVDVLIDRLKLRRPNENWGRKLVEDRCIAGIDKDPRAVRLAQLSVWLRLAEEPEPLPLPSLTKAIRTGDSLVAHAWDDLPAEYDIALGNPPFIPSISIENRENIERTFSVAEGRFDLAYVFLELCDRKLKVGGVFGLVAPNRVFTSRDGAAVRSLLAHDFNLLTVVDFGSNQVFPGASSYVALLVAEKVASRSQSQLLRYMRVKSIPERFPEWMLESADASGHDFQNAHLDAFNCSQPPTDDRWFFISPSMRALRLKAEQDSVPLGEIAELPQGIKTGANDYFVVDIISPATGRICKVVNGLGDQHQIESACLRPVVFGSDIQRYELVRGTKAIIYPYRDGSILTPDQLRSQFPYLWRYFAACRQPLASRSSLVDRGKLWYELAEKRSIGWLNSRKLLTRELARECSFAIDEDGTTFLIGGTAILPSDEMFLEPLLAYLNSKFVNTYLTAMMPQFGSSFLKFEPQVIARLPIPNRLINDEKVREALADCAGRLFVPSNVDNRQATEAEIDKIVDDMVGYRVRSNLASSPTIPQWLAQAFFLDRNAKSAEALDAIYKGFDDLLSSGRFVEIDAVLGTIELERLSLTALIGILSITLPVATRLGARPRVFDFAWRLCETMDRNAKKLLGGLREWSPSHGAGT
jgi:type I restriction-modification system DNA methylase subunit